MLDGHYTLLLWGGLHQHAPTTRLEALNLATGEWRAVQVSERSPFVEPYRLPLALVSHVAL